MGQKAPRGVWDSCSPESNEVRGYDYDSAVRISATPKNGDVWCYWRGTGSSSYNGTNRHQGSTMDSNVIEVGVLAFESYPSESIS